MCVQVFKIKYIYQNTKHIFKYCLYCLYSNIFFSFAQRSRLSRLRLTRISLQLQPSPAQSHRHIETGGNKEEKALENEKRVGGRRRPPRLKEDLGFSR